MKLLFCLIAVFSIYLSSNQDIYGRPYRKHTKEVFGIASDVEHSQEVVDLRAKSKN